MHKVPAVGVKRVLNTTKSKAGRYGIKELITFLCFLEYDHHSL